MALPLDTTIWRGMQVCHPAEWELSTASVFGEDGRCGFSDRAYERLDVRWRPLKYVPDIETMVMKHRQRLEKETELSNLTQAPPEWRGLMRKAPQGATIIHAGRFFQTQRLMVEAMLVWPQQRDADAEHAILESITPRAIQDGRHTWQAMGIEMTAPGDYDLYESNAEVGRVKWVFRREAMKEPSFTVQRIAMPEYWLKGSLADWLGRQLPADQTIVEQGPVNCCGHTGEQLLSRGVIGKFASLRGRRRLRHDWAWQCPIERRVYHVTFVQEGRDEELDLPEAFAIRCCRPAPVVVRSGS